MPERYPPDDAREWLNRAHSNLAMAKVELDRVYLEDLCFNAQQAAEKAIKGILMRYKVQFPHVHDTARLLTLVKGAGQEVPESIWEASELTPFAVVSRYPGMMPLITLEKYRELVRVAEDVVRWAEDIIRREMES